MNSTLKKIGFVSLTAMILVLTACKNKDPSVLKVFVRSSNNELVNGAQVIIIADVDSDPPTPAYVDTVLTNSSGFAYFNMDDFFKDLGKKETTGYFDILVKNPPAQGTEYTKCRAHIVNVKTVYLQP